MARYKHIDTSPRFIALDLEPQLLPGTIEHALDHLLDHEIDLSGFDACFRNDLTGATAYPPAMLLKIVLFADSRSIVSSRGIARACVEVGPFIALSGDGRVQSTARLFLSDIIFANGVSMIVSLSPTCAQGACRSATLSVALLITS